MVSLIFYGLFFLLGVILLLTGNGLGGLFFLVLGGAGFIAMIIIRSARKDNTGRFFSNKWNWGPARNEVRKKGEQLNIWDEMSQKRDEK